MGQSPSRLIALILFFTWSVYAAPPPKSPVGINGKLSVVGTHLVNQYGQPIQLRGVSGHGYQWNSKCYTDNAIRELAQSWQGDVFRIVVYLTEGSGDQASYLVNGCNQTDWENNFIDKMVNACETYGIYAIIDWHITKPGDPNNSIYMNAAKEFFQRVSSKYKDNKNVLYEICNEPSETLEGDWLTKDITTWEKCKTYAKAIIPEIRKNDSKAIVLVGTPSWSTLDISRFYETPSDAKWQQIRDNPLDFENIMYVFHFYADHHKYIYQFLANASNELPLFCTEWSDAGPFQYSNHNQAEGQKWVDWMYAKKISWCYFSYANGNAYPQNMFNDRACDNNQMGPNAGALTESGRNVKDWINTPPKNFPVKDSLRIETWFPTGTISLPTTTLRVETGTNATVRYSTSNVTYKQMTNEMAGSGTKVHTVALSNLKDRDTLKYYVCAATATDTLKTNQLIKFVVMLPHPECIDNFEGSELKSNYMGSWGTTGSISLESKTSGYNSSKCAYVKLNGSGQLVLKAKDESKRADLSKVTSISFAYKSTSECIFRLECNPMDHSKHFYHWVKLPASADWKWDTIVNADYQEAEGRDRDYPLDLSVLDRMTWNFNSNGHFYLDSLTFNGIFPNFNYVAPIVGINRSTPATVQGQTKAYQIGDALFLQYALSTPCMLTATLYDIQGKYITTLAKTQRQRGTFAERIKLPAIATEGLYVVKFNTESGLSPVRITTMKR
jgi:endoglucanase